LPQVVLDTNVVVAGLRSRQGASFQLLQLVGKGVFDIHLSVPLVLEYEEVLGRQSRDLGLATDDIREFLDYFCSIATCHEVYFLWRPFLPDPGDDMVMELAVRAECDYIVTFNVRDFASVRQFGLEAVTPRNFLKQISA
jgi:putative PIN family toxin of toxin-antitoxin system